MLIHDIKSNNVIFNTAPHLNIRAVLVAVVLSKGIELIFNKKSKPNANFPIFSYINDVTVTKPLKDGASDYIVKPFNAETLKAKLDPFFKK